MGVVLRVDSRGRSRQVKAVAPAILVMAVATFVIYRASQLDGRSAEIAAIVGAILAAIAAAVAVQGKRTYAFDHVVAEHQQRIDELEQEVKDLRELLTANMTVESVVTAVEKVGRGQSSARPAKRTARSSSRPPTGKRRLWPVEDLDG